MKKMLLQFYEYKPSKILLFSAMYSLVIELIVYLKFYEINFTIIGGALIQSLLLLYSIRYLTELIRIPLYIIEKITQYHDLENKLVDLVKEINLCFIMLLHLALILFVIIKY